ncbi:MAG: hypothetical protein QOG42_2048 [Solirubrobacteraceae bacterium]|nr:hypothetical protein [Solirubrobacteraceae bacterium]
MRQAPNTLLAVVLAAALAAGCGSDDRSSSDGSRSASPDKPKPKAPAKGAALKPTSARGQMVNCMQDAGFQVTHAGEDESSATNYTVDGDGAGSRKAAIVIYSNKNDAASAARKAGETKGLNTVAFGRAEFIRYDATDTEAGVLANCVAEGYAR